MPGRSIYAFVAALEGTFARVRHYGENNMYRVKYVVVDSCFGTDYKVEMRGGIPVWLFLVLKTKSAVLVGNQMLECEKNTCVLYPPMTPVVYETRGENYHHEEWIQFHSDDPKLKEPYVPLARPVKLINSDAVRETMRILAYENIANYPERENSMEALMNLLIYKLHDSSVDTDAVRADSKLLRLRSEIYLHPEKEWTVRKMADTVYLSESRLHTMYKETFHITCMNDVIMSRIQYAQNMLECTDKPVSDIAIACGYHGNEHFCRQFKEKTGLTPGRYREKYSALKTEGI